MPGVEPMTLLRTSGCPDCLCHHLAEGKAEPSSESLHPQLSFLWWLAGLSSSQLSAQQGHSSGILPALPDSFPGCISLPAAAPLLHPAAPWQPAHTAGCWRSKTDDCVSLTRYTGSSDTRSLAHTPVPEPCVCLPTVSDIESWLSGCSTTLSPHPPPGRVTPPPSGD